MNAYVLAFHRTHLTIRTSTHILLFILLIQRLLPPQTPRITRLITHRINTRDIQRLDLRRRPIDRERRRPAHPRIRIKGLGEVREVLLESLGNGDVQRQQVPVDAAVAVVERVRDVLAVQGGRDGELVCKGCVCVGAVQVVRVAGEDALADGHDGALQGRLVPVCAGVVFGVELGQEEVELCGTDGWEARLDEGRVGCCRVDEGGCEEEAFVRVVADHDVHVFGEFAREE